MSLNGHQCHCHLAACLWGQQGRQQSGSDVMARDHLVWQCYSSPTGMEEAHKATRYLIQPMAVRFLSHQPDTGKIWLHCYVPVGRPLHPLNYLPLTKWMRRESLVPSFNSVPFSTSVLNAAHWPVPPSSLNLQLGLILTLSVDTVPQYLSSAIILKGRVEEMEFSMALVLASVSQAAYTQKGSSWPSPISGHSSQ